MSPITKAVFAACAIALVSGTATAQSLAPLNSDTETDRIVWSDLEAKFGPVPAAPEGTRVGGVSKTLTNEYWRSLGRAIRPLRKRRASISSIRPRRARGTSLVSCRSPRR